MSEQGRDEQLGERLRNIRKRAGVTQAELARRLGYSQPMIAAIETGRRRLRSDHLPRVASILGVSATALIGNGEERDLYAEGFNDGLNEARRRINQVLGLNGEADTGPSRPASSEDDSGLAGGARVELGES